MEKKAVRKEWSQSSSATSGITAYSLRDPKGKEDDMPIERCTLSPGGQQGWRWGKHGKCYASRADAVAQAQAAYSSGFKEKFIKGDVQMNGPTMFAALTKVDEENRLVYGVLADETPDRADERLDYDKSKPYFKAWSDEVHKDSNGQSVGNLRAMHGKVAAGKFTELTFDDENKRVQVCAKVIDDNEWDKVLEGVYTGFSIGGSYVGTPTVQKIAGKDIKVYVANPSEGSLVDRPCNPAAKIFEVRKIDGSTEQRVFKAALPPTPTEHQVVGSDEEVAELAKVMEEGQFTVADMLDAAKKMKLRKDIRKAAADDAEEEAEEPKGDDPDTVNEEEREAGKMPTPAKVTPTPYREIPGLGAAPAQAAENQRNVSYGGTVTPNDSTEGYTTEGDTKLSPLGSGPDESSGGASSAKVAKVAEREDVSPKSGEHKYGDVTFADEKNKKYPIDNEGHIRAAWNYINKGKNAGKYSSEDAAAIRAKIVSAWKKHIDKEGPPSAKEGGSEKVLAFYGIQKGGNVNALVDSWDKWAGDFDKAMDEVSKHPEIGNPEAVCAWLHKKATGEWPYARDDADDLTVSDLEKLALCAQGILVRAGVIEPQIFKGMYQVSQLANLIDQIAWLRTACENEGEVEKDSRDADMADRLDSVLEDMCAVLADMVEDEGSELIHNGKAMTPEDILKMAYKPKLLRKVLQPQLEKVGRRHSSEDMKHIQSIHDTSSEMGGKCAGMSEKAHAAHLKKVGARFSSDSLKKIQHIHDTTTKLGGSCDMDTNKSIIVGNLSKAVTDPDELQRLLTNTIEKAVDPLRKELEAAQHKLRKYENTPTTPRGVLRAISKENDNGGVEKELDLNKVEPITTGVSDNLDRAATLIKQTHKTGGSFLFNKG